MFLSISKNLKNVLTLRIVKKQVLKKIIIEIKTSKNKMLRSI